MANGLDQWGAEIFREKYISVVISEYLVGRLV